MLSRYPHYSFIRVTVEVFWDAKMSMFMKCLSFSMHIFLGDVCAMLQKIGMAKTVLRIRQKNPTPPSEDYFS